MVDHPVLQLCDVVRAYPALTAVGGVSFALPTGGITCLLGPSGCGKSTLLRLIAGLEPVDAGEIHIQGKTVSKVGATVAPEHRGIGLVFQDNALFPHLNVSANVGFGLKGIASETRRARIAALLDRFQIGHLAAAWPHMLSGGEQQRVAIARAMAREPSLLLLDEPFSGLDGHLRGAVRDALLADLRAAGTSVLIVTHDPEEAMMIADNLVLMANGRVLQTGSPAHCYAHPESLAAARLLGDMLVVPSTVKSGTAQTAIGAFPAGSLPDGPVDVTVRPESIAIAAQGIEARVLSVRFAGGANVIDVVAGNHRLAFREYGKPPRPGDDIHLAVDMAGVRTFPGK